jgi:hypothetical protein
VGKVDSRAGRRDTGHRDDAPADVVDLEEGYLTIANAAKESGRTVVDFTGFAAWLTAESRVIAWRALRRFSARYSTATQTYAVRAVLELWREEVSRHGAQAPGPGRCPDDLVLELARLREALYRQGIGAGNMVATVSFKWGCFLQFLKDARAVGFLPKFNLHASALRPLPQRFVRSSREAAAQYPDQHHGRIPRTLNFKKDSYNEELLEPISISAADDQYLKDYEHRLRQAIQVFKQCALREFSAFERARNDGHALIRGGDYGRLKTLLETRTGPQKYVDPICGKHLFRPEGGHPNSLEHLLLVVHHEMGGIPRPYAQYVLRDGKQSARTVPGTPPHWRFVQLSGKNTLLPHLGLMSSGIAAVCFVLLLLEHPNINVTSLARATVFDDQGRMSLLLDATEDDGSATRLVLQKPRAGTERAVLLTPLSRRVIKCVIQCTEVLRKELRKNGKARAANRLWLGVNTLTYDVIDISEKTLSTAFRGQRGERDWGKSSNQSRRTPFVERHPELERWRECATLKALRVSVGVLEYLQSGGDLVAAARAFGHRNIRTTIAHYIPEALRLAIHERQIRRHQNILITSAVSDSDSLLKMTDFRTLEELHLFLNSGIPDAYRQNDAMAAFVSSPSEADASIPPLVLCKDVRALAVLVLYREHLRGIPEATLEQPDVLTNMTPRFWCEFMDSLKAPLPTVFQEVRSLIQSAEVLASELSEQIRFPRLQ